MTPGAGRVPRPVPPGRALVWFGEAIRLWKRGAVPFSVMAALVIAASIGLGPVPIVGLLVSNVIAPLLVCGFFFGCLAADRGEPVRFRQLFMVFAAPLPAQLAVVAAAFIATLVESAVAWWLAGVNLLLPGAESSDLGPTTVIAIYVADVIFSLPFAFVPMAALFDGERPSAAFASSWQAFVMNVRPLLGLGVYVFTLVLAGIATMGAGLVLALPWIAAAQYAAWKDIYGVGGSDRGAPGEVA